MSLIVFRWSVFGWCSYDVDGFNIRRFSGGCSDGFFGGARGSGTGGPLSCSFCSSDFFAGFSRSVRCYWFYVGRGASGREYGSGGRAWLSFAALYSGDLADGEGLGGGVSGCPRIFRCGRGVALRLWDRRLPSWF